MGALILILLQVLVATAWVVLLARIVLSFIDPTLQRPISRFVFGLTEPFLTPIRNVLPSTGQFDFSMVVLLFGLMLLMRLVSSV